MIIVFNLIVFNLIPRLIVTKTLASINSPALAFAGIDAGPAGLTLVIRKNCVSMKAQKFANTSAERLRLLKRLSRFPGVTVCLEASGGYYLDLALALADAGVRLMVLDPEATHNFAKVLLRNSETAVVDASVLARCAERMPYQQPWLRPATEAPMLRALSRRINTLSRNKAAARNHHHALTFIPKIPNGVLRDLKLSTAQLEKRIDHLTMEAKTLM